MKFKIKVTDHLQAQGLRYRKAQPPHQLAFGSYSTLYVELRHFNFHSKTKGDNKSA